MRLCFLHGLESGPHGRKYQALTSMFGKVVSPDCEGIFNAEDRFPIIQRELDKAGNQSSDDDKFLVVGSSFGGLMAIMLNNKRPDLVGAMVLCAPAFNFPETPEFDPVSLPPVKVIHGIHDEVVPIATSLPFGPDCIKVDDNHSLAQSIPIILKTVFEMRLELQYGSIKLLI
ncbi:MAG: YqiA/YcfP family alpha/beta fold hydrolase [Myxococcota bacterium]